MSAGRDGEARPGILNASSVILGQGPHPDWGGGAANRTPWGSSSPAKLVPGSCVAAEQMGT